MYYVDDRVENLKEELARGTKLKCSRCGQKGAALGCYMRSCRRTYHVPCAMQISKCRWNHVCTLYFLYSNLLDMALFSAVH